MMQSNGGPDGRYLPPGAAAAAAAAVSGMDYATTMDAHAAAAAHHSHVAHLDPAHAALHYGLPPHHVPHPSAHHAHAHQGAPNSLQTLHGPVPLTNNAVNKRSADSAGLDMMQGGAGSDSDEDSMVDVKPTIGEEGHPHPRGRGTSAKANSSQGDGVAASKKTRGRVKIKMEFIDNKLRRYTTFSKRKTGIMKKVGLFGTKFYVTDWVQDITETQF